MWTSPFSDFDEDLRPLRQARGADPAESFDISINPVGIRHRELLAQVPDDLVGVYYSSAPLFAIAEVFEVLDKPSHRSYNISRGIRIILGTGRPRPSKSDHLDYKESDSLFNRSGGSGWWN